MLYTISSAEESSGEGYSSDDKDRDDFVGRLGDILRETTTPCLAWALIPNHFHLLLVTLKNSRVITTAATALSWASANTLPNRAQKTFPHDLIALVEPGEDIEPLIEERDQKQLPIEL